MTDTAGSLMVEKYAAGAPDEVKTEATRRLDGWLEQDIKYIARGRMPPVNALHKSGAAGILYQWLEPGLAGVPEVSDGLH